MIKNTNQNGCDTYSLEDSDYGEDNDFTLKPIEGIKIVASFDYGEMDWDGTTTLLGRINWDLHESGVPIQYVLLDSEYAESIYVGVGVGKVVKA